jgi:hypothetical protein
VLPTDPRAVDIAIKVYFSSRNKKKRRRKWKRKGGKTTTAKSKEEYVMQLDRKGKDLTIKH